MGCYGEQDRLRRCLVLVFPIPCAKQVSSGKKRFIPENYSNRPFVHEMDIVFHPDKSFPQFEQFCRVYFWGNWSIAVPAVELYVEFSETRDFLTSVRQSRWSWGPLKISGNLLTHSYKGPGQKSWNEYSILPSTSYSGHVLVSHLVPNSPPHVHHLGKKRGNDCF